MKSHAFGIDLGGTTAKIGLFTVQGALLDKWEVATDTSNEGIAILPNLAASVKAKMAEHELENEHVIGVGIGVPGPVMHESYVPRCANLGGWGDLDVSATLSGLLNGIPVKTGNDANLAALGEYWMGSAKEFDSVTLVTLGTGVGGGIIINGKVLAGANGAGGEIGHITVNEAERNPCGCGKKGCLEQYSSATGVVRGMNRLLAEFSEDCVLRDKDFVAKDVFDAAKAGDRLALICVDDMAEYLGQALSDISATVDPAVFLLGGGVSKAGEFLQEVVTAKYKRHAFPATENTKILLATLGNDAGIYGAVKLVIE